MAMITAVQAGSNDASPSSKAFVSVLNKEGATITTGLPVALQPGVSNNGYEATIANAAADYPSFLGVAVEDVPNNDVGLVQTQGFINSILLSNSGTSITINSGDPLIAAPAGMYSGAPTYANSGFRFVIASNVPVAVSAAAYASGYIKP